MNKDKFIIIKELENEVLGAYTSNPTKVIALPKDKVPKKIYKFTKYSVYDAEDKTAYDTMVYNIKAHNLEEAMTGFATVAAIMHGDTWVFSGVTYENN